MADRPHHPQPARPRPGRSGAWLWATIGLAAAALLVWGGLWIVENPSSALYRAFLATAQLTVPAEQAETDEYLVFLSEDSPAHREALNHASPHVSYVADSLLPRVVVVRITADVEGAMAALQQQPYVSLVMKYNPAFGCH